MFEPQNDMTEAQAVDKIEKVFANSVDTHKISDVEVGCFLSSGVDSSMFLPIFRDKRPLRWDLILEKNTTKSTLQKRTADIVGLDHHYKVISSDEFWGNIKNVQYQLDQPLADPSCYCTLLCILKICK